MEDIIAYQSWIDKYNARILLAKARAASKRTDRAMRNLKNKANGGFTCLKQECSLDQPQSLPETM